MTVSRFAPPLDYLQAASRASLQSYEFTHLNHAANLRQEIAALIDQWITETSEAMLARWMLDHHKSLQTSQLSPADLVRTFVEPSTTLFPNPQPTQSDIVPAPPRYATPRNPLKNPLV